MHEENNSGIAFRLYVDDAEANSDTSVERFTYDGFNQLTEYTTTNGCKNGTTTLNALYKKVSYTYYADGLRASKSVNSSSTTTRYLWNGDNLYAEVNKDGSLNERYYRGYQLICDDSDTYYMHDAHGDITAYYNSNGTSIYNNYDAFGNSEVVNKFGYCDQQYDSETGYYYMRARYYDPATGRFISEDPIKDGFNWYSYCAGNPILYYDPNGLTFNMDQEVEMYRNGEISPGAFTYVAYCYYHSYLEDDYLNSETNIWDQQYENFKNGIDGHDPYTYVGDEYWDDKIELMEKRPEASGVKTEEIHYNRNEFNLNFTKYQLDKLQSRLPDGYKWG